MVWKCPPLHLPNWNYLWKWKEDMTPNRDGGKGDTPRPIPDRKKFEENWEKIFPKKPK